MSSLPSTSSCKEAELLPFANQNSTPSTSDHIQPSTSGEQASTSLTTSSSRTPVKSSYEKVIFSPFKKYLKISDSMIITHKFSSKIKPKTPAAVTGRDLNAHLLKIQKEKEQALAEKNKRKEEREKKKIATTTKRLLQSQIISDDDSLENTENQNMCHACYGEDGLDDGIKWIGCNHCPRWYHKTCLSLGLEEMSDTEIATFDFVCKSCEKSDKSFGRNKKLKK